MTTDQKYNAFVEKLAKEPPVPTEFNLGDQVTFTNEYGVQFHNLTIIGFAEDDSFYGRYIYLNTSSYWFPHSPKELTLETPSS